MKTLSLDITDMETCYKLFKKEAIAQIAPSLKEERFGFIGNFALRKWLVFSERKK